MTSLRTLIGQEEAAERLTSMLARGRLAHALMFAGPEGVGKATAARTLARILLCKARGEDATACDGCSSCEKISAGTHADLHVVVPEAATLKVDEIRDAIRHLQLRSQEGGVKILIVDGADRMTPSAQNALLKTLEEPPGAAHLILVAARPRLLLPTVLSRCQRVPFRPLPSAQLAALLMERRALSEPRAVLVAGVAQGSLGRAMAMDPDTMSELRDKVAEIDRRLVPGRPSAAFEALEVATDIGEDRANFGAVIDLLLVWFHDQARLAALGGGEGAGGLVNRDRGADLADLAEARGLRTILERAEVVLHARRQLDLPHNLNAQMLAEQLCLGLAGLVRLPSAA